MKPVLTLPTPPKIPPRARYWVAYSGGLDSTVLLHLAAKVRLRNLHAVHIHHGLQPAADGWAEQCKSRCESLGVPLRVLKVRVDLQAGEGMEGAARRARYEALRAEMGKGDVLITAHHQDDQAETVLLRLMRGAGVHGMAAMRALSEFTPGRLWRPLLKIPRAQLRDYAMAEKLDWIEDPHNSDPRYARVYVRGQVMPVLARQWPQAAELLARTAEHAAAAAEILDEIGCRDYLEAFPLPLSPPAGGGEKKSRKHGAVTPSSCGRGSGGGVSPQLSVSHLLTLSDARRRNLLRWWLAQKNLSAPSTDALQRLEHEVLRAKPDAQPLLNCGDYEFRRYRDQLFVMQPLPAAPAGFEKNWKGGTLKLPQGCGQLRSSKKWSAALSVRFPQGGERIRLAGQAQSKSLKNLFQEAGIPPWQRIRTPLIYAGDELICASDRWMTARAKKLGIRHQK